MPPHPSDPTQPVGRRERNKQRVKERLYASALALFTEQGYDQTSIDEIAERADVARGTFFNYFQRKEDLISAWGEERRTKLLARLSQEEPMHGSGPIAQLQRCMEILGRINEEERELTSAMLTAWVRAGRPLIEEPYVGRIFAEIVAAGCRDGQLTADLSAEQVGNVLRDVYLGALYRWAQRPSTEEPGTLQTELQGALHLLLHGIAQPSRC